MPAGLVHLGSHHAWDDPTERDPFRRSSRDADISIVDPNAVSDRRSVAPDALDTTDRSACCTARRDGVQADRPKRQPPSLDAIAMVARVEGALGTKLCTTVSLLNCWRRPDLVLRGAPRSSRCGGQRTDRPSILSCEKALLRAPTQWPNRSRTLYFRCLRK